MSFNKFQNNSYCVGGRHYSQTKNIRGDITQNKKTAMSVKLLVGMCSTCKRKKSHIVSDQTLREEGLGNFFSPLDKNTAKLASHVGKKILKNSGRALKLAANIGTAAASENHRLL